MKKIIISIILINILLFGIAGTTFSVEAKSEVVKIGVLAPLTGMSAADGEEMVRGAKMAAEEINDKGGVNGYKFKIVSADTGDQTSSAVLNGINFLVSSGVDVIITGYASTSNFEIEKMAELNMPYLLSAQSTQTREIISKNPEKYGTVWSFSTDYDAYGIVPAEFFEEGNKEGFIDVGDRKLAIVSSDCEYSYNIYKVMKKRFTELGWKIVFDEVVPFVPVYDWSAVLKKIRDTNPNLIINTDYIPANSAAFLGQFLEKPTNSYLFLQYAPLVPEFLELTKDKSTGVLYTCLGSLINSPKAVKTTEWMEKFRKKYGIESGPYGQILYEELYCYADALKKVGDPKDHTSIGIAIGETDKQLADVRLKFDPKTHLCLYGEEYMPLQFYQLWEGKRVLIVPKRFASGEFKTPPWMTTNKVD